MKKILALTLAALLLFSCVACLTACGDETKNNPTSSSQCQAHIDENSNDYCDICNAYLIVVLDFYVFNDLHGKFCDTNSQPGVDEIGTFFENRANQDDHIILLSTGDMWQGTAESVLTEGKLLVEWMNILGFEAMTMGNHEYDWGEEAIRKNAEYAEFPFLAINIYDKTTGQLVEYCQSSVMIQRGDVQIGIIGAIGDCYSSISSDMVQNVTFKVGSELTALVKAESEKLRAQGADVIVYALHDGKGESNYYDTSLSNGYVDLVFEGHTHQKYTNIDKYGVYHIQAGGENDGLSHVEIGVNSVTGKKKVTDIKVIKNTEYKNLADHAQTEALEDRYRDIIDRAYAEVGKVSTQMSDSEIEDLVAQLYLEAGQARWKDQYQIVLGGGMLKTRAPYDLSAGNKTYADLFSILPFNNRLALCSISGYNLKNRFINTSNSDYHIALSDYGKSISIENNATYYVIVDTYTALYAPNRLTVVDYYDETTYARDLLADAIREGRLNANNGSYTLTPIKDALSIGQSLSVGQSTTQRHYIRGTVKSIDNTNYGNLYLVDESGNQLYIYGLYDTDGNRFGAMANKPKVGDSIVVTGAIFRYSASVIELKNATLIEMA